mmetsp:Transcript_2372/g.7631  ORF Transcript_2372/g.7631 Transcript_2372/m.7631 type:complete len:82 (+) Transcript_2372:3-248(+)|eukprot:scaffold148380_cov28-Tisochrysis_lutea.AAC.1
MMLHVNAVPKHSLHRQRQFPFSALHKSQSILCRSIFNSLSRNLVREAYHPAMFLCTLSNPAIDKYVRAAAKAVVAGVRANI